MTKKVSLFRKWTEPIPIGRDGKPIPKNIWPRRRKHVWVVRWFAPGPDGKIVRPSRRFPTREEAEKFRAEKQEAFNKTPHVRRVARRLTLGEFTEEFKVLRTGPKARRLKATTMALHREALAKLEEYLGPGIPIQDIDSTHVTGFIANLHKAGKLSASTINKTKGCLKAAFNAAVKRMNLMRENPFADVAMDKVTENDVRYVTPSEFSALMNAATEACPTKGLWWRAFLTVCYTAGLRLNEAVHLTWADVDFERDIVRVSAKKKTPKTLAWEPKDREMRKIPVPSVTTALLAQLQDDCPAGHTYVFLTPERLALARAAMERNAWNERQAVINNIPREFRRIVERAALIAPTLLDW